jgi:hypothetical protein
MAEATSTGDAQAVVHRPGTWNSLEIAKLIMSSATPVMILFMGFILSQQSARQAEAREKLDREQAAVQQRHDRESEAAANARVRRETLARDDAIRRAAAAAEERTRLDTLARDDAIRRATEDRDDAIRRAGEARDAALRADTLAREATAGRESERLARLNNLIQKRAELWDHIGPLVTALYVSLRTDPPDLVTGRAQLEEVRRAWVPFIFYFPSDFNAAMESYLQALLAVLDGRERPDNRRLQTMLGEVRAAMEAATEVPETLSRP